MTDYAKRYLRIHEADGSYTFHRFYIGTTHINLKTSSNGLGYKAVFIGDDKVVALSWIPMKLLV